MAKQIFRKGTPLTVIWSLTKPDGTAMDLAGYRCRLYYATGNRESEATSTVVSANNISWVFAAAKQTIAGDYRMKLRLYQNGGLFCEINYEDAFSLFEGTAEAASVQSQDAHNNIVNLHTVAEYYLLQPVVPVVGDDLYWYVNGVKLVDSLGQYVSAEHTVDYDQTTHYIIIDKDRVDAQGQSIAQTITAIAEALKVIADEEDELERAEGQGDYSDPDEYPDTRRAQEVARQQAEEARQAAEGDENSVPGDGSRRGNELQRMADEGSPEDEPGADTRWGAEKARRAAEGTPDDDPTDPDVNTRWAQFKRAIIATLRANRAAEAAEHQVDVKRGYGIAEVTEPVVSNQPGGRNTIRLRTEDNRSYDVYVYNGRDSHGLFADAAALAAAKPNPAVGDYAFVGSAFPADIYVCATAGTWEDSGNDYGGPTGFELADNLDSDDPTKALSARQGKTLDGKISQLGQKTGMSPYKKIQHTTGGATESSSGNRYSLLFNVPVGLKVQAISDFGSGIIIGIWDNEARALEGVTNSHRLQYLTPGDYTKNLVSGVTEAAGVMRIGTKKADNSAFTSQDIQDFLSSLQFYIGESNTTIDWALNTALTAEQEVAKKISNLSWISIFTDGIFNANNTTHKIEIPAFRMFDEFGSHDISEQEININWGSNSRQWFALVVSDDYSTVNMIEHVDVTNHSKLLALIKRASNQISNPNASAIDFYGGEGKFSIDGRSVSTDIEHLYKISENAKVEQVNPTFREYRYVKQSGTPATSTSRYLCSYPILVRKGQILRVKGYCAASASLISKVVVDDETYLPLVWGNNTIVDKKIYADADAYYCASFLGDGTYPYLIEIITNTPAALSGMLGEIKNTSAQIDYTIHHNSGSATVKNDGNRLSACFFVNKGDSLNAIFTDVDSELYVLVYDSLYNAVVYPANYSGPIQDISGGYVANNTPISGIVDFSGVLILKWKLSSGASFNEEKKTAILSSLTYQLKQGINAQIDDIKQDILSVKESISELGADSVNVVGELPIGPLTQNTLDSNGHISSASTVNVSQKSALMVPYTGVVVKIKMPTEYCVKVYDGWSTTSKTDNLSNISNWLHNGDTYAFDTTYKQIYRLMFGKNNGVGTVTVEEIQTLLSKGDIALTYENYGHNVVLANSQNEGYIKNIMRKWYNVLAQDDSLTKMPTFTHLSDIHGDAVRFENFVKYSEALGVDAGLVSGDLVPMDGYYDKVDFINDIIDKHNVMTLLCMGNHDARQGTTAQRQNEILAHNIEKYNLTTPAGVDYPTYYYKDFTSKSIRLITLNLYMPGQYSTNHARFTQEQLDWLVATLASTPSGYGIVIMMHAPEVATTKDANYAKFWNLNDDGSAWPPERFSNASPIAHIVDAFISKQSNFSYSFTETRSGGTDEIVVTADFSSVASGVEFICYVTGHHHRDRIGYVSGTTNMQLMCNICLGIALYGNDSYNYYAEMMDLPRGGKGQTQDSFNLYVVDRTAKTLRIARAGSNMLPDFTMRDYMIIPYANS